MSSIPLAYEVWQQNRQKKKRGNKSQVWGDILKKGKAKII